MGRILVLGASENPGRYSNAVIHRLLQQDYDVIGIGRQGGEVGSVSILEGQPHLENIDTITLYLNPKVQEHYKDYIISLGPRRIIFNPGTENPVWYPELEANGIEVEEACNLVLLSTGQF